jgi:hypothetical protein
MDQGNLANTEERTKRELEDLRLERKEQEPRIRSTPSIEELGEEVEDVQAETANLLKQQLEDVILTEGLSAEQVQAEQAEQAAQAAAAAQATAEEEAERLKKKVFSLMKKVPTKKTYLKILNKKDLIETQQTIQSYLIEIDKFTEKYFKEYKPFSFLEENFERGQLPEAKNYFIIGVILLKLAAINKFTLEFRQQILERIKVFNTIFSIRTKPLLDAISGTIQQLDEYKTMVENIREINTKTKK